MDEFGRVINIWAFGNGPVREVFSSYAIQIVIGIPLF